MTPEVSVVMPCAGAAPHVRDQLEALAAQRTERAWELVVADNGMTAAARAVVDEALGRFPCGRVADVRAVRGPAYARTAGARVAAADLLLFCDDDDVVGPCWLEEMAAALETADLVGGRLRTSRLNARTALRRDPLQEDGLPAFHGLGAYAMSSSMGVRRAVFEAAGGFDPELYPGEDVDLGWRVRQAGGRLAFVPAAVVDYRWRDDPAAFVRQSAAYGRTAGLLWVKHRDVIGRPGLAAELAYVGRLLVGARHLLRPGPRRTRWWAAVRFWAAERRVLLADARRNPRELR